LWSSYMYRIDNEIHFKNFIKSSLSVVTFKSMWLRIKCFRSLRKNFLSKCFMLLEVPIWLRESIQFWLLHSHLLTYFSSLFNVSVQNKCIPYSIHVQKHPPPILHPIFNQYNDYVYYVSSVSLLIYNSNVITYVS
jgi:hypothetical protein